mgnify:CR=1 FL=1
MKLRKSDQECDKEIDHLANKGGIEGWHEFKSLKDAVANHPNVMRKISPAMIDPPGINPYKKVEMNEKYKEFVPLDLQDDELYQPPTETEKNIVKEEKGERGNLRKSKKQKMLEEAEMLKIEKLAGDGEQKQVPVEKNK